MHIMILIQLDEERPLPSLRHSPLNAPFQSVRERTAAGRGRLSYLNMLRLFVSQKRDPNTWYENMKICPQKYFEKAGMVL